MPPASQIKNEKRCGIGHAKGDTLVYCHEALHLKDKLQKAGYEAKTVKWDFDSDSTDESDDEKDLMQLNAVGAGVLRRASGERGARARAPQRDRTCGDVPWVVIPPDVSAYRVLSG